MAENTELGILENLKKGMVDNTDHEGEVLENFKKGNESLCRVVHICRVLIAEKLLMLPN